MTQDHPDRSHKRQPQPLKDRKIARPIRADKEVYIGEFSHLSRVSPNRNLGSRISF